VIDLGAGPVVPLGVEHHFPLAGPGGDPDVIEVAVVDRRADVARLGEDLAALFFVAPGLEELQGRFLRDVLGELRVPGDEVGIPQDLAAGLSVPGVEVLLCVRPWVAAHARGLAVSGCPAGSETVKSP